MDWARILAYVTVTVDQELLGRNEYLAAENRILKAQLKGLSILRTLSRLPIGAAWVLGGVCRNCHHGTASPR